MDYQQTLLNISQNNSVPIKDCRDWKEISQSIVEIQVRRPPPFEHYCSFDGHRQGMLLTMMMKNIFVVSHHHGDFPMIDESTTMKNNKTMDLELVNNPHGWIMDVSSVAMYSIPVDDWLLD